MTVYNKFVPSVGGGTAPVFAAAAASDQVQNPTGGVLVIRCGATGTTATLVTPGNLPNGDAYPDKAIVVPANQERWVILGPEYSDGNNQLSVNWSSTVTTTWACVSMS